MGRVDDTVLGGNLPKRVSGGTVVADDPKTVNGEKIKPLSDTMIINDPHAETRRGWEKLERRDHIPSGGIRVATAEGAHVETTLGTIGIFEAGTGHTNIGVVVPISRHDSSIKDLLKILKADNHETRVSGRDSDGTKTIIYTAGNLNRVASLISTNFGPGR